MNWSMVKRTSFILQRTCVYCVISVDRTVCHQLSVSHLCHHLDERYDCNVDVFLVFMRNYVVILCLYFMGKYEY